MKLTELNDLIAEFLLSKPLKPNSRRAYKTDLFFFAQFYAAEKFSFEELNKSKLLQWLSQFPPRAGNRRGTNVRKFLLWLEDEKGLKINQELRLPWKFQDPTPKNPDRSVELPEEELTELLTAKSLTLTKRILLGLLIETGATLEELSALKWEDLNLGKLAHVTIGEAGKARVVPIGEQLAEFLRELKKRSEAQNDNLFTTDRRGEPVSAAYMAMMVRRSTLKVLDREISPTQLHEFAKQRLLSKYKKYEVALQLLGKKKAVSLIRIDKDKIDIERLRKVHKKAFK